MNGADTSGTARPPPSHFMPPEDTVFRHPSAFASINHHSKGNASVVDPSANTLPSFDVKSPPSATSNPFAVFEKAHLNGADAAIVQSRIRTQQRRLSESGRDLSDPVMALSSWTGSNSNISRSMPDNPLNGVLVNVPHSTTGLPPNTAHLLSAAVIRSRLNSMDTLPPPARIPPAGPSRLRLRGVTMAGAAKAVARPRSSTLLGRREGVTSLTDMPADTSGPFTREVKPTARTPHPTKHGFTSPPPGPSAPLPRRWSTLFGGSDPEVFVLQPQLPRAVPTNHSGEEQSRSYPSSVDESDIMTSPIQVLKDDLSSGDALEAEPAVLVSPDGPTELQPTESSARGPPHVGNALPAVHEAAGRPSRAYIPAPPTPTVLSAPAFFRRRDRRPSPLLSITSARELSIDASAFGESPPAMPFTTAPPPHPVSPFQRGDGEASFSPVVVAVDVPVDVVPALSSWTLKAGPIPPRLFATYRSGFTAQDIPQQETANNFDWREFNQSIFVTWGDHVIPNPSLARSSVHLSARSGSLPVAVPLTLTLTDFDEGPLPSSPVHSFRCKALLLLVLLVGLPFVLIMLLLGFFYWAVELQLNNADKHSAAGDAYVAPRVGAMPRHAFTLLLGSLLSFVIVVVLNAALGYAFVWRAGQWRNLLRCVALIEQAAHAAGRGNELPSDDAATLLRSLEQDEAARGTAAASFLRPAETLRKQQIQLLEAIATAASAPVSVEAPKSGGPTTAPRTAANCGSSGGAVSYAATIDSHLPGPQSPTQPWLIAASLGATYSGAYTKTTPSRSPARLGSRVSPPRGASVRHSVPHQPSIPAQPGHLPHPQVWPRDLRLSSGELRRSRFGSQRLLRSMSLSPAASTRNLNALAMAGFSATASLQGPLYSEHFSGGDTVSQQDSVEIGSGARHHLGDSYSSMYSEGDAVITTGVYLLACKLFLPPDACQKAHVVHQAGAAGGRTTAKGDRKRSLSVPRGYSAEAILRLERILGIFFQCVAQVADAFGGDLSYVSDDTIVMALNCNQPVPSARMNTNITAAALLLNRLLSQSAKGAAYTDDGQVSSDFAWGIAFQKCDAKVGTLYCDVGPDETMAVPYVLSPAMQDVMDLAELCRVLRVPVLSTAAQLEGCRWAPIDIVRLVESDQPQQRDHVVSIEELPENAAPGAEFTVVREAVFNALKRMFEGDLDEAVVALSPHAHCGYQVADRLLARVLFLQGRAASDPMGTGLRLHARAAPCWRVLSTPLLTNSGEELPLLARTSPKATAAFLSVGACPLYNSSMDHGGSVSPDVRTLPPILSTGGTAGAADNNLSLLSHDGENSDDGGHDDHDDTTSHDYHESSLPRQEMSTDRTDWLLARPALLSAELPASLIRHRSPSALAMTGDDSANAQVASSSSQRRERLRAVGTANAPVSTVSVPARETAAVRGEVDASAGGDSMMRAARAVSFSAAAGDGDTAIFLLEDPLNDGDATDEGEPSRRTPRRARRRSGLESPALGPQNMSSASHRCGLAAHRSSDSYDVSRNGLLPGSAMLGRRGTGESSFGLISPDHSPRLFSLKESLLRPRRRECVVKVVGKNAPLADQDASAAEQEGSLFSPAEGPDCAELPPRMPSLGSIDTSDDADEEDDDGHQLTQFALYKSKKPLNEREGRYSVWRGQNLETREAVAIKELPRDAAHEREVDILAGLAHACIVRFRGVDLSSQRSTIFLVTELITSGSLQQILLLCSVADGPRQFLPLPMGAVKAYTKQILLAISYLHERGIVHRDISAQNIMVKPDGTCKVIDFGESVHVKVETAWERAKSEMSFLGYRGPASWNSRNTSTLTASLTPEPREEVTPLVTPVKADCVPELTSFAATYGEQGEELVQVLHSGAITGTPIFMSPQACRGIIHRKNDIWAVGVLVFYCLTGMFPYAMSFVLGTIESGEERIRRIGSGDIRVDLTSDAFAELPAAAQDFIAGCLSETLLGRATADELLESPFIVI